MRALQCRYPTFNLPLRSCPNALRWHPDVQIHHEKPCSAYLLAAHTTPSCSRGVRILPDEPSIDKIAAEYDADILILPGGGPGAKTFCDSDTVLELVKQFRERGKFVGAICAGTTALVKSYEKEAGKVQKAAVTSHPSVEKEIRDKGWSYSSERVVVDGRVVTSRG